MTFDDAVKVVDNLLTTEAKAAHRRGSMTRLDTLERRSIEMVLGVALNKADPLPAEPDA